MCGVSKTTPTPLFLVQEVWLPNTDHDRYQRMKSNPHLSDAAQQWVLGYEAGWNAAAERWLTTPQLNGEPGEDDTTTWLVDVA